MAAAASSSSGGVPNSRDERHSHLYTDPSFDVYRLSGKDRIFSILIDGKPVPLEYKFNELVPIINYDGAHNTKLKTQSQREKFVANFRVINAGTLQQIVLKESSAKPTDREFATAITEHKIGIHDLVWLQNTEDANEFVVCLNAFMSVMEKKKRVVKPRLFRLCDTVKQEFSAERSFPDPHPVSIAVTNFFNEDPDAYAKLRTHAIQYHNRYTGKFGKHEMELCHFPEPYCQLLWKTDDAKRTAPATKQVVVMNETKFMSLEEQAVDDPSLAPLVQKEFAAAATALASIATPKKPARKTTSKAKPTPTRVQTARAASKRADDKKDPDETPDGSDADEAVAEDDTKADETYAEGILAEAAKPKAKKPRAPRGKKAVAAAAAAKQAEDESAANGTQADADIKASGLASSDVDIMNNRPANGYAADLKAKLNAVSVHEKSISGEIDAALVTFPNPVLNVSNAMSALHTLMLVELSNENDHLQREVLSRLTRFDLAKEAILSQRGAGAVLSVSEVHNLASRCGIKQSEMVLSTVWMCMQFFGTNPALKKPGHETLHETVKEIRCQRLALQFMHADVKKPAASVVPPPPPPPPSPATAPAASNGGFVTPNAPVTAVTGVRRLKRPVKRRTEEVTEKLNTAAAAAAAPSSSAKAASSELSADPLESMIAPIATQTPPSGAAEGPALKKQKSEADTDSLKPPPAKAAATLSGAKARARVVSSAIAATSMSEAIAPSAATLPLPPAPAAVAAAAPALPPAAAAAAAPAPSNYVADTPASETQEFAF